MHDIEHWYWEAFWELSTDRQAGMSDGPIPWSSIKNYCVDSEFAIIIRAMDSVYMSHKSGEGQEMTKEKFRKR